MKVFTETPITKERFLFHLRGHQKADAFRGGTYSVRENGTFKGCAVGCSIESICREIKGDLNFKNHKLYEKYLGVPEWVAILEDTLFEGISESRRKTFPVEFGEALQEGSDLDNIKTPFIVYLMQENLKTLDSLEVDGAKYSDVFNSIELAKKAVKEMIEAHASGDEKKLRAARSAVRSARAAMTSTEAASWAVESAADAADAARPARTAEAAAWSAEASVEAAAWAAWAVQSSVDASDAARSAEVAAWSASWSARAAAYKKHTDKFLNLVRGCK